MKKKLKLVYLGVGGVVLVCLLVAGLLIHASLDELGLGDLTTTTPVEPAGNILYKEPKNPTGLQTQLYDELIEATKNFPEEYDSFTVADLVVKSFVADFYTWTNKDGNFDVGGLDYVYGPTHLDFGLYARDTFYQNFNFFEKEYGVENLIEVESIETNVNWAAPIEINGKEYRTYYVEAEWTYKPSEKMDVSQFQSSAYYNVVYNEANDRFEIALTYELD